jgi:hypothetical protein
MKALFIELPPFERYRQNYLTDEEYRNLQNFLLFTHSFHLQNLMKM